MKYKVLISVMFLLPAFAFGGGWDDYKPSTFGKIIDLHHNHIVAGETMLTPGIPFRVQVVSLGEIQNIQKNNQLMLEHWQKSFGLNEAIVKSYKKEIKVFAEKKEFWLPIQGQLLQYYLREAPKKSIVDLYVVFVGTYEGQPVFIVNEFEKSFN